MILRNVGKDDDRAGNYGLQGHKCEWLETVESCCDLLELGMNIEWFCLVDNEPRAVGANGFPFDYCPKCGAKTEIV